MSSEKLCTISHRDAYWLAVWLLVAMLLFGVNPSMALNGNDDLVQDAIMQIENNCGDCQGSSRAALQSALDSLTPSAIQGSRNERIVLRALAEGYRSLELAWSRPGSEDAVDARQRRTRILERLITLEPTDGTLHYDLAMLQDNLERRIEYLRKALTLDPQGGRVAFQLGISLIERKSWDEGSSYIALAIRESSNDPDMQRRYRMRGKEILAGSDGRVYIKRLD